MSNIQGAGYGLFAKVDIKEGELVCIYTGECTKVSIGRGGNKWMLACSWYNAETDAVEQWYIDSFDQYNAAGRWINDARNTEYSNNCTWERNCSNEPHITVGKYYVNIVATRDIKKGEELLMSYGANYWQTHENMLKGTMHDRVLDI